MNTKRILNNNTQTNKQKAGVTHIHTGPDTCTATLINAAAINSLF